MKRALITGHRGFVGRHLIEALKTRSGWSYVGFDIATGDDDILNYERIRAAVEQTDPDIVIHLAAQAYVAESRIDPARTMAVNIDGTHNLLRALRATGSRAVVLLAGTSEEYGYETQPADTVTEESPCLPTTVYGVSKLAATVLGQVYAREYGLHVISTRAWNHTGPGQSSRYALSAFARRIAEAELTGQPVRHGDLSSIRNFCDVRDVVGAYLGLVTQRAPVGVYNVAGPYTMTMGEFLAGLRNLARIDIDIEWDPSLVRPGHASHFPEPLTTKIRSVSGWGIGYKLTDTLRDLLDYWRDQL